MSALICGSLAYDTIMVFPDRFKDHILPDKMHILNVTFTVPEMLRDFGGVAGDGRSSSARDLSLPLQTRLVGMAQKHDTAVVVLTEKPAGAPSLGSLVSLRVEVQRQELDGTPSDKNRMQLRVLKDKRRGPGRVHQEICHGPSGLC